MFHYHQPAQPVVENQAERENKVFVGMLPKSLDEKDLYDIFRSFGELKEVPVLCQQAKREMCFKAHMLLCLDLHCSQGWRKQRLLLHQVYDETGSSSSH